MLVEASPETHGVRVIVVSCPWCDREHTHPWPADAVPDAVGLRRCPRGRGVRGYTLGAVVRALIANQWASADESAEDAAPAA